MYHRGRDIEFRANVRRILGRTIPDGSAITWVRLCRQASKFHAVINGKVKPTAPSRSATKPVILMLQEKRAAAGAELGIRDNRSAARSAADYLFASWMTSGTQLSANPPLLPARALTGL
jgi:hypothetical protein